MAELEYSTIPPIANQYIFIHFQTLEECNLHVLNNKHLQMAYKCCGGKGVAYPRINKLSFPTTPCLLSRTETFISTQGTCDICFEESKPLFNTCNTCKQPFCKPCLKKIKDKICPYCRGKLNNNFD